MIKVLWFSRHSMTPAQMEALGNKVEIKQIDRTIQSAYELEDDIKAADIIAIVAPINLQQQFLKIAGNRPVIMAVNERVLIPQKDGTESKVEFVFQKWEQLDKIEVVKHDFDIKDIVSECTNPKFIPTCDGKCSQCDFALWRPF